MEPRLPHGQVIQRLFQPARLLKLEVLACSESAVSPTSGRRPPTSSSPSAGTGIAGTGLGNKGFYRAGFIGMWFVKKFDVTTMYFHGWDNAFLGSNTPANAPLPTGARSPSWNGALHRTTLHFNPRLILISRYEAIRMSQQAIATNPANFGNIDAGTVGFRFYPFSPAARVLRFTTNTQF